MIRKAEIYQLLDAHKVTYEVVEHPAVFTVDEAEALGLPHPEAGAKNLFLRDDKKENYYLVTLRDKLLIDLKQMQERIGSRRLSFASADALQEGLGLERGSVTPFYRDSLFKDRRFAFAVEESWKTDYPLQRR